MEHGLVTSMNLGLGRQQKQVVLIRRFIF